MKRGVGVALIVVLAACGGGGGGSKAASGSSSDATLKIRDQAAQLKAKAGADFAAANDGQGLAIGDTLRTNGTGFAQVNYHDGSLTRLDANAQFTLTDLAVAQQSQRVVGHLDGGRAWNNVQKISSSEGRYEIDTDVATASVRGTQFNIDCTATDGSCTFSVVDGTVTVTPAGGQPIDLHAGDALTVRPDHTTARTPADLAESWIAKNLTIDTNELGPNHNSGSSSSTSSASGSAAVDPCTFSPAEIQAVVDVAVAAGTRDGQQICRYSPVPNPDQIAIVTVVVSPSASTLDQLKSQAPPVPVDELTVGGEPGLFIDTYPNTDLFVIRDGIEFDVEVASPYKPDDSGDFLYDAATLRDQTIQLMEALLAR